MATTRKSNDSEQNREPTLVPLPGSSGNGTAPPATIAEALREDGGRLDELERLAADALLDDDDGDEPGEGEEPVKIRVEKKLPQFAIYRTNPVTFDLWGASERKGLDEFVYVTTKSFAPKFEDDLDLRRIRLFEVLTTDGILRLIWCTVPDSSALPGDANTWVTTKLAALELGMKCWATMRSRKKHQQYTFRPASRQNYGEPVFSGLSPVQHLENLRKDGLLVDSEDHPFYRKATDQEG